MCVYAYKYKNNIHINITSRFELTFLLIVLCQGKVERTKDRKRERPHIDITIRFNDIPINYKVTCNLRFLKPSKDTNSNSLIVVPNFYLNAAELLLIHRKCSLYVWNDC